MPTTAVTTERLADSVHSVHAEFDSCSIASPPNRLLSMKSANALLCVPRGDGELPAGQLLPAILIADLPPPSAVGCYHAKVENEDTYAARSFC